MSPATAKIDRFFLFSVIALTIAGFVIFLSAALGLLARDGADFSLVALKQAVSLVIGVGAFYLFSRFNYHKLRAAAFFILIGAIIVNLLLFIPGLSLHHGGAARWIDLGFISFQPSEFLKIAFIIYIAAWVHFAKDRISRFKYGVLPYMLIMALLGLLLFAQHDNDTLAIIGFTGLVMLFVAGLPIRHLIITVMLGAVALAGALALQPHALQRIATYFDGAADVQGAGYQVNQSLIAIGSGQFAGKGFGQSIQKFGYLPEPIGDSIFAVAAEEFGFLGSLVLLALYISLAASMFRIGTHTHDSFGSMLAIGLAVLIITESFMNIGAMIGIIPLSGLPLLFVSHGGTALIIILAASGMVANVSKYAR
ncbi:MAG: cell division protein FtsW [Candidatus Pacebacteria bacterium]|nr:cell division protein FtsW [Candidatus Paceibacterota bacterium]